jgi:MFS transporter, SP family, sugar:H+ symporter
VIAIGFICSFEFGPGPIVWLYISEICNDKATSVGTVVNWFWTLVISLTSPYFLNDWLPYGRTWLMFSIISAAWFFFILFCMKETKGKTEAEVKALFVKSSSSVLPR